MTRNKILVVVNSLSGTVRLMGVAHVRKILTDGFADAPYEVQIEIVEPKQLHVLVDAAIADPAMAYIVVGGGDGTQSSVAAKLVETDIGLGILPLGTMNLFALANGISNDLSTAVQQLKTAHMARIDVGQVNSHMFLRQLSLGLQPKVVEEREIIGYRSSISKKWSGLKALVFVLMRLKHLYLIAEIDGNHVEIVSPALYISNNEFTVGIMPRQGALDQGVVAVYAFHSTRVFDILKMTGYILRGVWWQSPNVKRLVARELTLSFNPDKPAKRKSHKILASLDGELKHLALPMKISSHNKALHVLQGNAVQAKHKPV